MVDAAPIDRSAVVRTASHRRPRGARLESLAEGAPSADGTCTRRRAHDRRGDFRWVTTGDSREEAYMGVTEEKF